MKEVVKNLGKKSLTQDERKLFSVAYTNVLGSRRNSYRVLQGKNTSSDNAVTQECIDIIEKELKEICDEVIVSL